MRAEHTLGIDDILDPNSHSVEWSPFLVRYLVELLGLPDD